MNEVVGDRLALTVVVSLASIVFVWVVSFPIAVYSAVRQYSIGDYVFTFLGYIGLATPSFLMALILLYFANVYFGISIGGLMDPQYIGPALELGQVPVDPGASLGSGAGDRPARHRRHDPAPARQPAGRAQQAIRRRPAGPRACRRDGC